MLIWLAMALFPAAVGGLAGWLRLSWRSALLLGITATVTFLASAAAADTEPGSDNPRWFFWAGMAMFGGTQALFATVAYVGARAFRSARTSAL